MNTHNCSSPRKSLVKGERFIRSEEKPEHDRLPPLGTSQSDTALSSLMVVQVLSRLHALRGIYIDNVCLTGTMRPTMDKCPWGWNSSVVKLCFRGAPWVCKSQVALVARSVGTPGPQLSRAPSLCLPSPARFKSLLQVSSPVLSHQRSTPTSLYERVPQPHHYLSL